MHLGRLQGVSGSVFQIRSVGGRAEGAPAAAHRGGKREEEPQMEAGAAWWGWKGRGSVGRRSEVVADHDAGARSKDAIRIGANAETLLKSGVYVEAK